MNVDMMYLNEHKMHLRINCKSIFNRYGFNSIRYGSYFCTISWRSENNENTNLKIFQYLFER